MQLVKSIFETIYENEIFIKITDIIVPNVKPYYWISNYGRVWSESTNTFLIPHTNENGYWQISLITYDGRVFRKIHRLVLLGFKYFPGCEQLQGNHKDGNKNNNYLYNLEWSTPKENIKHAIDTGLRSSYLGETNPGATITDDIAREIGELIMSKKYSDSQISIMTGVNESIVKSIANCLTWRHLFSNNELEIMKSTRRGYYINDQEKHQICLFFQNNAKIFNKVIDLVKASLLNINLELSDRNIRITKRLYYRYDSPEITSLYNY